MAKSLTPKYIDDRVKKYPPVENQLDMLWNEVKETGTISDTGEWYLLIKNIKADNPKPE